MASRRGSDLLRLAVALAALSAGAAEGALATSCPVAPRCAPRVVWPPDGADIPVNPRIVVEGCDELELALARPALEGAGDPVPLRLVERLADGSLAFEPALLLHPATPYELDFRRLPGDVAFAPPTWITRDETDTTPPSWSAEPRVSNRESTLDPEGQVSLVFELPLGDEPGPLAVLVQLAREPRGMAPVERPRLRAIERSGLGARLRLSGGDCTPWPDLGEPGTVTARLVLLDVAGNRSPARIVRIGIPETPPPRSGRALTAVEGADYVSVKHEPDYPEIALKAGISGVVSGWIVVRSDGGVVDVRVEKGLPMGLEEAATKALYQWRFHPSSTPERRLSFETHFLLVPTPFDPDWNLD